MNESPAEPRGWPSHQAAWLATGAFFISSSPPPSFLFLPPARACDNDDKSGGNLRRKLLAKQISILRGRPSTRQKNAGGTRKEEKKGGKIARRQAGGGGEGGEPYNSDHHQLTDSFSCLPELIASSTRPRISTKKSQASRREARICGRKPRKLPRCWRAGSRDPGRIRRETS